MTTTSEIGIPRSNECPIQVVLAGEPIDCAFPRGHDSPHSWAVPTPQGVDAWRKRPVVLQAVQLTDSDDCDWDEIAVWCGGRIYNVETAPGAEPETRIDIPTLEGIHTAMEGDWIVQGSAGEFWRVERDRFGDYYEPAGDPR